MRVSLALAVLISSGLANAAEPPSPVLPSLAERFDAASGDKSVDFQRHVIPLLGRLGCNGRACHGSFQGQGDFRLSLFGYDFRMDYEGLLDRLDLEAPDDSYALQKALGLEDHGGGARTTVDDWQYKALREWVAAGAPSVPVRENELGEEVADPSVLVELIVEPAEIVFDATGQVVPLQAVAVWDDGTREDVTPLARFRTNDEQIAVIDELGHVQAAEPGATHVVVMYDNGVTAIPVSRPMPGDVPADAYADYRDSAIDQAVASRLKTLNIEPSEEADDATFLRRVSLDIAGSLPTASEVRAFLADASPDKRARKIDELLETPAYVDWWTMWLADLTGNSEKFMNNLTGGGNINATMWQGWLRARVAANMPYDEIVRGIVMAESRLPGESFEDYSARWSDYVRERSMEDAPGLTTYWARSNFRKPEERAIGFAYTFLGLRIECAQCHKHPFDTWTQADFGDFQNFFLDTRWSANPDEKVAHKEMLVAAGVDDTKKGGNLRKELESAVKKGNDVPFFELVDLQERRVRQQLRQAKKRKRKVVPKGRDARVLGGEEVGLADYDDPREPLMNWLVGDARDLFARAAVNRIWARYFGRGIVQPTDDLSLANPPTNGPLLDALTEGFIASGYDLKWVHRAIANSRTYQTSWQPTATNKLDEKHFARAYMRRLPAEVAVDAVVAAAADDTTAAGMLQELDARNISSPLAGTRGRVNYALTIFGKNTREANCDCERSDEPSLLQTIYLRNDGEVLQRLDRAKDGWLSQIAKDWNVALGGIGQSKRIRTRPENYDARLAQANKAIARAKERDNKTALQKAEKAKRRLVGRFGDLPAADADAEKESPGDGTISQQRRAAAVEEAYLRTLSRMPTDAERENGIAAIGEAETPMAGLRDLLWALLNTKEFRVNH